MRRLILLRALCLASEIIGANSWAFDNRHPRTEGSSKLIAARDRILKAHIGDDMTHKPKVLLIQANDWCGIYVDGFLEDEGHSLSMRDVLDAVGVEYEVREFNEEQQAWLEDDGHLPVLSKDLP